MLKNFQLSSLALVLLLAVGFSGKASAVACGGRFPNPVTDICWLCLFPINIGTIKLTMQAPWVIAIPNQDSTGYWNQ
jgi:conjugal transfer pilus assembly protein TraU